MREKVVTWILLGLLLIMAAIAMPGCGVNPNQSQKEIERQRDLPDLETLLVMAVIVISGCGNNSTQQNDDEYRKKTQQPNKTTSQPSGDNQQSLQKFRTETDNSRHTDHF